MAGFCPLFSGSSGNCTYIAAEGTGLLIDAGVSARRIEQALTAREIDPRSVAAIAVTHEHSDHIAGLRVLCKRYGYRLIASEGTLRGVAEAGIPVSPENVIGPEGVTVGSLQLRAFPTPHDTPESTGYTVTLPDGRRVAVATDMGHMTERVLQELCGCDAVLIESNHDVCMLKNGPYPYVLKQRILSERGHLSNEACDAALPALVQSGVKYLYLGHLSRENNRPELAYRAAGEALQRAGIRVGTDCRLGVAPPEATLPILWL